MADKKIIKATTKAPVKKTGNGFFGLMIAMSLALGAVMVLPTTLIIAIGIVPTAVAFFVDTTKEKSLGPTVCFLNCAGILPSLIKLWSNGHTVDNAIAILSEPHMMLMMLVPAGLGWMLYAYMPMVVSGMMRRKAEGRIRALERDQEKLIDEWGGSVTGLGVSK